MQQRAEGEGEEQDVLAHGTWCGLAGLAGCFTRSFYYGTALHWRRTRSGQVRSRRGLLPGPREGGGGVLSLRCQLPGCRQAH